MELKVWVEGIQRIVCGVTETTTCQDVVYALAHATGKTGRFTLIERWRNNERLLAPQEHPLKVLTKWGEYSNDVQLILQRSGGTATGGGAKPLGPASPTGGGLGPASPPPSPSDPPPPPDRNKDIRKSLTFSGGGAARQALEARRNENVGAPRNVPPQSLQVKNQAAGNSSPSHQVSPGDVGGGGGKREAPPYRDPPGPLQRVLPPYRDPPPPTTSTKPNRNLLKEFDRASGGNDESVLYNSQYRDLVCLVNYQRDKLSSQQAELTKYDAEIVFWEGKTREQQHQLDFMSQETARIEAASRQAEEQLRLLGPVEEENEIVRQQEKTLKSELTLLRSKLANCETELLQCKNKIRVLMEEVAEEVRAGEERSQMERSMLAEVERLQQEVEEAKQGAEMAAQSADALRKEVQSLETAITEKPILSSRYLWRGLCSLPQLPLAPGGKNFDFEALIKVLVVLKAMGPHKPGSTRRMIGSPRQLENAVPTSKNPHGVWV
ncbi:ras association domain-containing protein 8 [Nilaparvata lugens]|uniref:ras association domain-containing protein 8 n=1 Tax=Nilaparvata lugens TaxID=108931 RepID=UPI00193E4055|nr:ras association domain-containing protein 8 [Nilaparvata lugens]